MKTALASIERLNFRATEHGLTNCCVPDGKGGLVMGDPTSDPRNAEDNSHAKQIFVGEDSCAAMTLIDGGHAQTGMEVLRRMWHAIVRIHEIGAVIAEHMWYMTKEGCSFDEGRYMTELRKIVESYR